LRQPQRLEELASADPRLRIAIRGRSASTRPSSPQVMPMAALEAFQLAFPLPELPACFGREVASHPLSQQVALLIKSFPPRGFHPEWHWLELRAAEDPRIHMVASNLERDELLALYGCCDVFLSLHRSEGFGRGMAEALQLGVDVRSPRLTAATRISAAARWPITCGAGKYRSPAAPTPAPMAICGACG